MPLTAIALNCSLKKSLGEASSTDAMIAVLKEHLAEQDVELAETIRIADYNVPPGVTSNEGEGVARSVLARVERERVRAWKFRDDDDG